MTAYFGRSGILDAARYEGGPPGLSLPAQGDRATAMTLVAAILLGLRHRDQTGKGCWVGTSLYANGAWANGTTLAGAAIGGKLVTREPPHKPKNALTNLYRTKDDRWLQLLMVRDDRLWPTFCAGDRPTGARDRSALHRPRGAPPARARTACRDRAGVRGQDLCRMGSACSSKTGIPFGVIGRVADVVDDEQAKHAGIFADTTNPDVPRTVNNPIRLGFAKPRISGRPSAVGENNEEVLRELAYSEAEIEALKKAGALG